LQEKGKAKRPNQVAMIREHQTLIDYYKQPNELNMTQITFKVVYGMYGTHKLSS
jgi:hypothetical protein